MNDTELKAFLKELRNLADQWPYTVSCTGCTDYDIGYENARRGDGEELQDLMRKHGLWTYDMRKD